MKKSCLIGASCAAVLSFTSIPANAALIDRGGGFIYDDALDITWTQNANINGVDTWANQVAWADSLSLYDSVRDVTWDDWRLASMDVNGDTAVVNCNGATEPDCLDNELGYMFYQNMDGSLFDDKRGNQLVDGVLLTGVQSFYWSGTVYAPFPTGAWDFNFASGDTGHNIKASNGYGWAVRAGDVSAVPVPGAVWLFGSDLLGLVGMARRKKAT